MPVRHYLLFATLFLSTTLVLTGQTTRSAWWYPLGNMEGTRRNPDTTARQSADLVIKWRAPLLHNSPTILAGGIRSGELDRRQQVVGLIDRTDSLVILSPLGMVEKLVMYNHLFSNPHTLSLTGLFNLNVQNPLPQDRPSVIGIGVERRQREKAGDAPVELFAMLVDRDGTPERKFVVDPLPNTASLDDQSVGIYPVAAFSPQGRRSAYVVVSQNGYRGSDSVVNSIRRYRFNITGTGSELLWSYSVGPRIVPPQPSISADPSLPPHFALSTLPYPATTHRRISPDTPSTAPPTFTDTAYSITVADNNGVLEHKGTIRIPPPGASAGTPAASRTYFFTLYESRPPNENGRYYRLLTEEHDAAHGGQPRMWLYDALTDDPTSYGELTAPSMPRSDLGWTIVAADIDGRNELDRTIGGPNAFVNNFGDEIVAALRAPDDSDVENNLLFGIRRNLVDRVGDQFRLRAFVKTRFNGRLMAAGDLVDDTIYRNNTPIRTRKQELVVAYNRQISILQLKDYNDDIFGAIGDDVREYFDTLRSYTFDSRVVSVAIADLEGDGENDLIVNTLTSTYSIGKRDTAPLGAVTPDSPQYCRGNNVKIAWNRKMGGGQNGLEVFLLKSNNQMERLQDAPPRLNQLDPHNPGTGPDTLAIPTAGLEPGTYRVLLKDPHVEAIAETSAVFSVNQPVFTDFTVDTGAAARFGEQIILSAKVFCSNDLVLRRSIDGGAWETLPATVEFDADSATAFTTVDCPAQLDCGGGSGVNVRFQFVDRNDYGASEIRTIEIPVQGRPIDLIPDSASRSRSREITWNSADFACGNLEVLLSIDGGSTWTQVESSVPVGREEYAFEVPEDLFGRLKVRVCCADASATCEFGISSTFEIPKSSEGNYVAPNPFDPGREGTNGGDGAMIVYGLKEPGTVSVTIFDASRAVVARLLQGEEQEARRQRVSWNGRNSRNDIVASGTYICIIESSSGEQIVLPIIVVRH